MGPCGIHQKDISQEMLKISVIGICSKSLIQEYSRIFQGSMSSFNMDMWSVSMYQVN